MSNDHTIAPADRPPHRRWSPARKFAAYAILASVAVASVWFINRRVDALADDSAVVRAE